MPEHTCKQLKAFERIEKDFQGRNAEIIELRTVVNQIPVQLERMEGMLKQSLDKCQHNDQAIKEVKGEVEEVDNRFRSHEIESPVVRTKTVANEKNIGTLFSRQWGLVIGLFMLVLGVLAREFFK